MRTIIEFCISDLLFWGCIENLLYLSTLDLAAQLSNGGIVSRFMTRSTSFFSLHFTRMQMQSNPRANIRSTRYAYLTKLTWCEVTVCTYILETSSGCREKELYVERFGSIHIQWFFRPSRQLMLNTCSRKTVSGLTQGPQTFLCSCVRHACALVSLYHRISRWQR